MCRPHFLMLYGCLSCIFWPPGVQLGIDPIPPFLSNQHASWPLTSSKITLQPIGLLHAIWHPNSKLNLCYSSRQRNSPLDPLGVHLHQIFFVTHANHRFLLYLGRLPPLGGLSSNQVSCVLCTLEVIPYLKRIWANPFFRSLNQPTCIYPICDPISESV